MALTTGGIDVNPGLVGNEPFIAINPLDANNVVVAQFNNGTPTLKISLDGGTTFSRTTTAALPTGQTGYDNTMQVAFDATGRLFWDYLTSPGEDLTFLQVNPTTGARIGIPALIAEGDLDKALVAADKNPASPFANNLYAVYADAGITGSPVRLMRSTNQGAIWSPALSLPTDPNEGDTYLGDITVAPSGDVWVAWHTHIGSGSGTSQEVRMRRSRDGGATFDLELIPFPAGTADISNNVYAPRMPGVKSWLNGAQSPRVLIDPVRAGNIYVVSVDDPDNAYTATSDYSDIVIARSTDFGATWTRSSVSHAPGGTLQTMPAAAIDAAGNIVVTWYDTRRGLLNPIGDFLLDVYASTSFDGGLTFGNDVQINDVPFDPERGAPDRNPPYQHLRIGEYNGLAAAGGKAYAVWTGNNATAQQAVFDKFPLGFQVASITPDQGLTVIAPPTDFVVQFTEAVDPASLTPSDFLVNGLAADSLQLNLAHDTATFHFNASPVVAEGPQVTAIAAGAVTRQSDAATLMAFAGTFFFDSQPLTILSTTPPAGTALSLPAPLTFDVNFSDAVAPASVQASDLVVTGISGATVSSVSLLNSNTTARFTLTGVSVEGTLNLSMAAGAITGPTGVPGPSLAATVPIDGIPAALPVPLSPKFPLGSLDYESTATGVINLAGDTDDFTLSIDSGQTITVAIVPSATDLQPAVELHDPLNLVLGSVSSPALGRPAVLQTIPSTSAGTYTIRVGAVGNSTGGYSVQVYLNTGLELANLGIGTNSTLAAAQDLDLLLAQAQVYQPTSARAVVKGSMATFIALSAADAGYWDTTGKHTAFDKDYFAGRSAHDFFVFDLSTVKQPVTAARLNLSMPATGYTSVDPTETFALFDVSTPLSALQATTTGQVAIHNDLGTGTGYGSRDYSAADNGTTTSISINADGLAAINASLGLPFAVGGAVTTLSPGTSNQAVFNGTGGTGDVKQFMLTLENSDYYSLSLYAGQKATVGIRNLTGSGTTIAIKDEQGQTLASGAPSVLLDQRISNFVAPADGRYYVLVSGNSSATYSLVVTRDLALDQEGNDTAVTAQPLGGSGGAAGAIAPSPVVPSVVATTEANGGNGYPFNLAIDGSPSMRYQQIYSHAEFNRAGAITAIRFRRNGSQAAFDTSGIDVKINLGYSATTVVAPSTTFANNVGPGTTTVFDGLLALASSGTGSPNPFDIVINLTTPFVYDPSHGDLLLDVFMRNSPATGQLDYSTSGQQVTTRRITAPDVNATTGSLASTYQGLVTRFDMAPDEDWYSFNVANTASALALETITPADGPQQFGNALDPHLELYDPTGKLVAAGVALADGRNESIAYQPLVTGTYRVRVTGDASTSGEYTLGKNLSPVATGAEIAVLEDGFINIYPDMTDVESPPRFVILAGPKHGMLDTPSGNHPYWPNVGFGYLPDANYYGDDSIVFEARDSVSASGPATISLNVQGVNDAPTLTAGAPIATTDEAGAVCVPNWAKNLSAGPNESAQILSIAVSSFDHALLATATIDLAGQLCVAALPNKSGTAAGMIKLSDDGGTDHAGVDQQLYPFSVTITKPHPWYNTARPLDVTDDGFVAPADALETINYINAFGGGAVPPGAVGPNYYDTDKDNFVSPADALAIINAVNAGLGGEGEAVTASPTGENSADVSQFAELLTLLAFDVAPIVKRRP